MESMRLPTICVSEPMTPVTSTFISSTNLRGGVPILVLNTNMPGQRERERQDHERHHRAADRAREKYRPIVLEAEHAGHERALGLCAENAAEHHRRDRKLELLKQVADDTEHDDHPQVCHIAAG